MVDDGDKIKVKLACRNANFPATLRSKLYIPMSSTCRYVAQQASHCIFNYKEKSCAKILIATYFP